MKVVLESGAKDTQTDGHKYDRRDPERVQTIFRLPGAISAPREHQGNSVIEEVAPDLGGQHSKPETE